jgi:hypothetical protein
LGALNAPNAAFGYYPGKVSTLSPPHTPKTVGTGPTEEGRTAKHMVTLVSVSRG